VCSWNVITFVWALLCIQTTIEVGHYMVLVLKKLQKANTQERWNHTLFDNRNNAHSGFLKKTYETPFAHSFHMLGPASTGDRNPGIGLFNSICPRSCLALLCLMTIFQIDLNCIKVFPIIMMSPEISWCVPKSPKLC
jgi:hypothetical protein